MNAGLNIFGLKQWLESLTLPLCKRLLGWPCLNKLYLSVAEFAQVPIHSMLDLHSPHRIHAGRQVDKLAIE